MNKTVAFLPAGRDACALWRLFLPHLHTQHSKFVISHGPLPLDDFIEADVCVVQRLASRGNLKAIEIMHATDKKVIYDLDDNMWQIPPYNPARYSIAPLIDGFETCASQSDLITVSTEALKRAVLRYMPFAKSKRIEVMPNALDFSYFGERTRPEDDKFILGWGGTATHSKDTQEVYDILPEVLKKEKDLNIEIVCSEHPDWEHKRLRYRGFVPVGEYASRLSTWGWDVFIAPLEKNDFNLSKSNIKILEAAAVGAPILVSDVGEYARFCSLHKDLKFLVCKTPNDWKRKIVTLMHEPEMRKSLVKAMRKVVEEHFDIRKVGKQWQQAFDSL